MEGALKIPAIVFAGTMLFAGGGCGKSSAARDGSATIDGSLDGGPPTTDGPPTSDGAPGTDGSLPLSQLCDALKADVCAFGFQCAGWEYRDLAHCMAEVACLGVGDLQSSVASGALTYDPVEAAKCQARFQGDPCHFGGFVTLPTAFQIFGRCPGTLTPARGAGAACVAHEECTAGNYCKKQTSGAPLCPGQCTALAQMGQPCMSTPCAPGLYCSAQTCRPYAHAQETCASDADCYADPADPTRLWCDLASHTCRPPVGEGATCGIRTPGGDVTVQLYCAPGLWCDALFIDSNGTCRKPGGSGSPCTSDLIACTSGLHCAGYEPRVKLGTCASPVPSGGACFDVPYECDAGLHCDNGTCTAPSPAGGPCTGNGSCQSGLVCDVDNTTCKQPRYPGDACGTADALCVHSICRAGHCADLAPIGQPCVNATDCQLGLGCWSGVCRDSSICTPM